MADANSGLTEGGRAPPFFSMAFNVQNKIVLVLGAKGYGKTYFARKLAAKLAGKRKILFLDVSGSFRDSLYRDYSASDIEAFLNSRMDNRLLATVTEENAGEILTWLASLLPHTSLNMVLVIDEGNLFTTSHQIHPGLRKLIALGRHSRLDIIITARDPQELSPRIRSQADAIVCFRISRARELQWCSDENPKVAAELSDLPPRAYRVLTCTPSFTFPKL